MRLRTFPISLREVNSYLATNQQRPLVRTHLFSVGCFEDERLVGIVVVERPKAEHLDDGQSFEPTRICSDHDRPQAAWRLIASATRAACALGGRYLFTYAVTKKNGVSFRVMGWRRMEDGRGKPFNFAMPSRRRAPMAKPMAPRYRWERYNPDAHNDMAREAA